MYNQLFSFAVGAVAALVLMVMLKRLGFPAGVLRRRTIYSGPSHFIQLSNGRVKYRLIEPNNHESLPYFSDAARSKPLLVCCHGFSLPSEMLTEAACSIANQNDMRVLVFDLYARGWSDAPDLPNTPTLFVGQIAELLLALGETGPFSLLGVSMGGAIVTHFAQTYPDKVNKLILVAAAGLPLPGSAMQGRQLLSVPLLGSLIGRWLMPSLIKKGAKLHWQSNETSGPAPDVYKHWQSFIRDQVDEHEGLCRSLVSSLCHFPLGSIPRSFYQSFASQHRNLPILLIWGTKDALIPLENGREMTQLLAGADGIETKRVRLVEVSDGTHSFIVERPNETAAIVTEWIRETDKWGMLPVTR